MSELSKVYERQTCNLRRVIHLLNKISILQNLAPAIYHTWNVSTGTIARENQNWSKFYFFNLRLEAGKKLTTRFCIMRSALVNKQISK